MDLAKIHFCGPQNPNIFSHKILVPDPISYWMPYLNSSWNFLSENVYFWYGRAKIFQVKLVWSSRGAKFSELGDVTRRVASSKRTAISIFINLRYLRLNLLKNKENNTKICDIFNNFKNIPCYVMSEVSLKKNFLLYLMMDLLWKLWNWHISVFAFKLFIHFIKIKSLTG